MDLGVIARALTWGLGCNEPNLEGGPSSRVGEARRF